MWLCQMGPLFKTSKLTSGGSITTQQSELCFMEEGVLGKAVPQYLCELLHLSFLPFTLYHFSILAYSVQKVELLRRQCPTGASIFSKTFT